MSTPSDRQIAEALAAGKSVLEVMRELQVPGWRIRLVIDAAELIAADVPRPAELIGQVAATMAPPAVCAHEQDLRAGTTSRSKRVRAAAMRAAAAMQRLHDELAAERKAEVERERRRAERKAPPPRDWTPEEIRAIHVRQAAIDASMPARTPVMRAWCYEHGLNPPRHGRWLSARFVDAYRAAHTDQEAAS